MQSFFILSAPRSGSTLLALMLGAHRSIVTLTETFWFVAVSPELKRIRRSPSATRPSHSMYEFLRTVAPLGQLGTPPDTLREIVDRYQHEPDHILPALVADYARRAKPSAFIWGEKTPPHGFYVGAIERVFPDMRYIYLARDPRANVNSIAKPSYRDFSNDWGVATHVYLRFNQAIERSLGGVPPHRQLRLHYEDLVARPRDELQRCCDFLGVEFEPGMLAHQRFTRDPAFLYSATATQALTSTFAAEWKDALTPIQVRCIERFTARLQVALRYERSNPKAPLFAYVFSLAVLGGKHFLLTMAEGLVQTARRRPFVWTRLSLMSDRFLRRIRRRFPNVAVLGASRSHPGEDTVT